MPLRNMQEEWRLWNGVVKKMPASNVCTSVSQQELIALEGELLVPCSLGEEVGRRGNPGVGGMP